MEGELYRSRINLYNGPEYKEPTMRKNKNEVPENTKEKVKSNKKYGKSKDSFSAKSNPKISITLEAVPAAGYSPNGAEGEDDSFNDDISHFSIESKNSPVSDNHDINEYDMDDDSTILTHGSVESEIKSEDLTSRQRMTLTLKKC